MFCQLEMLRNCIPQNIRRVLRELPASLDETYERMLREIMTVNPDQVYRLLQCITVSTRPLRVDELAEVLALDFDLAEEGIPVLNEGWRSDDAEQGILSICSSLIVVVNSVSYGYYRRDVRAVQFAHFSVKEFLTSDRLAGIKAEISRFHIRLEPAHTIIAQSCLAILLQSDQAKTTSPLSEYAARHWVGHAQFGNVSLRVEDGMRRLFDPEKPYFTTWPKSYLDKKWSSFLGEYDDYDSYLDREWRSASTSLCLYYAALCGFHDLTRYLLTKQLQHVDASDGANKSPLAAALYNRWIEVAQLLYQHGAVLPIGYKGCTLLHAASKDGLVDVTLWLLDIGADAIAQDDGHRTPLHSAAASGHLEIARILLGHGVNVDVTGIDDYTPLHEASSSGGVKMAQLLIEHGADVHARDQSQSTPLHLASYKGYLQTVQLLIKHGADVNARDKSQSTPLHLAWHAETAQLLIKHGADVHAWDQSQSTPLLLALHAESVKLLIEHGADVHARDQSQSTPLHRARNSESVKLLIEHGADVHARDQSQSTPLHLARHPESVKLLIEHGADRKSVV